MRAIAVLLFVACAPSVEEPPAQEVASRRQIASGVFRDVGLDGSSDEGGFVVALADPDETGGTLTLHPFEGGAPCEAGRAADYETHGVGYDQGVLLSPDPVRLGVRDTLDAAGIGPIRFVGADCARSDPAVPEDLQAPPFPDFEDLSSFIVWTRSGDVSRIDPWGGTIAPIASGVTRFEPGWQDSDEDGRPELVLWLVEDGALVALDGRGEELLRAGAGVTELSVGCTVRSERRVTFLEGVCPEPQAAWVDATGLHVTGAEAPIAVDACRPIWLTGIQNLYPDVPAPLPPTLAYLSPCAEGTLHLRTLDDDAETIHESGVADVRRLWSGAIVYVKDDGPAPGIGTGFVVPERGADSVEIADGVELATVEPYAVGLLALAHHDGTSGDLGIWTEETGFLPAIQRVSEFADDGLLAVLSDFGGETGTLDVVDVVSGASEVGPEGPIGGSPILEAQGVPRGGFRWSETTDALDYLEDFDADAGGRLRTWIVPDALLGNGPGGESSISGEEGFVVDEGVAEWREIQWPDAGEIYVVRGGDREGLWYADWRN